MIAFTDAQRSSAADQIEAYGVSLAGIERSDAEQYADLALAAVADDVQRLLDGFAAIKDFCETDENRRRLMVDAELHAIHTLARHALEGWQK